MSRRSHRRPAPSLRDRHPVERQTCYVKLLDEATLDSITLHAALVDPFDAIPAGLRLTLTWDEAPTWPGTLDITADTGTPIFFWDPAARRNAAPTCFLRQYFPKLTDLSIHTPFDPAASRASSTRARAPRSMTTGEAG